MFVKIRLDLGKGAKNAMNEQRVSSGGTNNKFAFLKTNCPILFSIICFCLYLCPFRHVVYLDHEAYFNVFQNIKTEFYWILFTSCILFVISVFATVMLNFKKAHQNKTFRIFVYSIYLLSLVFFALTFVFGYGLSANGIK